MNPLTMEERETLDDLLVRYATQEYELGGWGETFFLVIEAICMDCRGIRHDDERLPA
jgi:hypothetical protein